MIQRGL
ncbi:hypothetical protein D018_4773A, partial [Vibrio parahaemolyticus VP2007-007]